MNLWFCGTLFVVGSNFLDGFIFERVISVFFLSGVRLKKLVHIWDEWVHILKSGFKFERMGSKLKDWVQIMKDWVQIRRKDWVWDIERVNLD